MLRALFEASTKGKSTQVFFYEGVGKYKYIKSDRSRIEFLLLLMSILFTPMLPTSNCHAEPLRYTFQKGVTLSSYLKPVNS